MGYGKGKIGRPRGTSKYPYATEQEEARVVQYIRDELTDAEIAARMEWADPTFVRDIRAKYFPTTGLASAILQAGAAALARRVIAEADVEEALDVLSRPNVGVLKPLDKGQAKPAFLTSVQIESLGAVRVSTAVVDDLPDPVPVPPAQDTREEIRAAHPRLAPVFDVVDRVVDDVVDDVKPTLRAALTQTKQGRTALLVPVPPSPARTPSATGRPRHRRSSTNPRPPSKGRRR